MESKNKVLVAAKAHDGNADIVLKYHPDGYFTGHSFGPAETAMFETREDARRALRQVARDSVIFEKPHNVYILDNGNTGYREDGIPSALHKHHRALSPKEIANERKFGGAPKKHLITMQELIDGEKSLKTSAMQSFCDGLQVGDKRPYNLDRAVDFKAQEVEHAAAKAAAKLPEMERSLIAEFAERCKMGFAEYGPVFLGKRNWGKELKEEALDGLFYALMAAKTMEKYGDFIKALEEASDDELSMDACSPDPLKQATYLLKQAIGAAADLAAQVADRDKTVSKLSQELADSRQEESMNMTLANALANELGMARQVRDNYKESYEKLRKENLDMRAAMEAALSLGSPRG